MESLLELPQQALISCLAGVLTKQSFRPQAALFWHAQRQVCGEAASTRSNVIWVENNLETELRETDLTWLRNLISINILCLKKRRCAILWSTLAKYSLSPKAGGTTLSLWISLSVLRGKT